MKEIIDIIRERLEVTKKGTQIIHCQGNPNVMKEIIGNLKKDTGRLFSVHNLADPRVFSLPFPPFLETIKDFPQKHSLATKSIRVLHPSFYSFLTEQALEKGRFPLSEIYPTEKSGILKQAVASFEKVVRETAEIIVILNFQLMPLEGIQFLRLLAESPTATGAIVIQMEDTLQLEGSGISQELQDYLDGVWIEDSVFDLPPSTQVEPSPSHDKKLMLENLLWCQEMLCHDHGLMLIDRILGTEEKQNPDTQAKLEFTKGVFLLQMEQSQPTVNRIQLEEAAASFKQVIRSNPEDLLTAQSSIYLGIIFLNLLDHSKTMEWSRKAIGLLKNTDQKGLLALGYLLEHIGSQRSMQNDTWDSFAEALKIYQELGWEKEQIVCLFSCAPVNRLLERPKHQEYLELALAKAQEIQHLYFQSTTLHLLGFTLAQSQGEEIGFPYLMDSLKIRQQLGDNLAIIRIQNGLAYSYLNQAKLIDAAENLQNCLENLYQIRDFQEICLTLLNLATTYFFGRDFARALEVIHRVLRIMHSLEMDNLIFQNIHDVYLLRSYLVYRNGESIRARSLFHQIEIHKNRLNPNNLPLFYALKGWFAYLDEDREEMVRLFDKGIKMSINDKGIEERQRIFLLFEKASAFMGREGFISARDVLSEIAVMEEHMDPRSTYKQWIRNVRQTKTDPTACRFPPLKFDLKDFDLICDQEKNLRGFQSSLRDIRFLNQCMEINSTSGEPDAWIHKILEQMDIHYPGSMNFLAFWNESGEEFWSQTGQVDDLDLSWLESILEGRSEYFGGCPEGFCKGPWETLILRKLETSERKGCLGLAFSKENVPKETDKNVLKLLNEHISSQLMILEQKEKLEHLANTDSLTGIPNRKLLEERLEGEWSRWKRYGLQSSYFCLAVLDLDNFKAHNDAYGHPVGDLILRAFSAFLKTCLRDCDFLARLGGDEFVILFPETKMEDAKIALQRILVELRNQDSFKPVWLTESILEKVDLPPLGCSIGLVDISELEPKDQSIQDLMEIADKSLYEAKKKGKNKVEVSGSTKP